MMWPETIDVLLNHRSIRKFKSNPIPQPTLAKIIEAAQQASTSSSMQCFTVINVSDRDKRKQLAELSGNQAYIEECPVFLVWCADLFRYEQAAKLHFEGDMTSTVENFIVATVDTALAAQNAAIAAESLGYGIVYIGGIRNNPQEVSALLGLPSHVYPVFGMCMGEPDQAPLRRPRLPQQAILHEDSYDQKAVESGIREYDETIRQYMLERSEGKLNTSWSESMAAKINHPRLHMGEFLRSKGFLQQ